MSATQSLSIFLTGATGQNVPFNPLNFSLITYYHNPPGYIGGSILWRLLHHKDASTFRIRALIRDATKAKSFASEYGIEPVVGSLAELSKLENEAANADYVIATVSYS